MSEQSECITDHEGGKQWRLHGQLHRADGPAWISTEGTKSWYQNDLLHRVDGPAVEHSNGSRHWYLNGKRHREDGPSVEYSDGKKVWHLNDRACLPIEVFRQGDEEQKKHMLCFYPSEFMP